MGHHVHHIQQRKEPLEGEVAPHRITACLQPHSTFLEVFSRCQNHLLGGDGPLPHHYRHYIAIMACSRYGCDYLVEEEKAKFLGRGGPKIWLEGIHRTSHRLRRLSEVNKILAHRPWELNHSHIKSLTVGEENWSLAEIVQAIVILVHFHSACTLIAGGPILKSPVTTTTTTTTTSSSSSSSPSPTTSPTAPAASGHAHHHLLPLPSPVPSRKKVGVTIPGGPSPARRRGEEEAAVAVMGLSRSYTGHHMVAGGNDEQQQEEEEAVPAVSSRFRTISESMHVINDEDEVLKRFKKLEDELDQPLLGLNLTAVPPLSPALLPFITDPKYQYEGPENIPTHLEMFVHEFSWDEHGYSLMSRLCADMCLLLDDKFRLARHMGDRKRESPASSRRRAIWNYVQSLYGIRHDDYDYQEVGRHLRPSLCEAVRAACCNPSCLTDSSMDKVMLGFSLSEKVVLRILIMEAKHQAELLYALRAVMEHMA